jgi:polyhydroxyalkanoate synthase
MSQGKIGQTDFSAFEVGKNLATTKGSVVFENDLFQLIQYAPTNKNTYEVPLLFIPAWINKFYIADLQPKNSLVKWLVEQGYTVFLISWVNPTEKQSALGFEDYVLQGLLGAVDEVLRITNQPKLNAIGYCLGGTLLATALAYLQKKKQNKIGAATFLTTMLDFSDVGEISVFIDEEQISALENRMSEKGFLDGSQMSMTFNMLRSNDLIWSFVINNYLLGKTPFPFDILYWNSDSTRMPAKMHSYYLRNMYLKNLLAQPNALEVAGVKIDLTKITNPAYFLSTKKDHISPWKTTYLGAQMLKNACFTIADSGHVAGVVNPPATADKPAKYHHWTHDKVLDNADEWMKKAHEVSGSWWPSWDNWNKEFSGKMIEAIVPKNEIEPAPGRYVKS